MRFNLKNLFRAPEQKASRTAHLISMQGTGRDVMGLTIRAHEIIDGLGPTRFP